MPMTFCDNKLPVRVLVHTVIKVSVHPRYIPAEKISQKTGKNIFITSWCISPNMVFGQPGLHLYAKQESMNPCIAEESTCMIGFPDYTR
jgi:hypothetical protein